MQTTCAGPYRAYLLAIRSGTDGHDDKDVGEVYFSVFLGVLHAKVGRVLLIICQMFLFNQHPTADATTLMNI